MWSPISFPITAEHGEIFTEHGSLSFSQILLNMHKSLLNMEPNQFPDYCLTWRNLDGTQKPISFPNISEHIEILT